MSRPSKYTRLRNWDDEAGDDDIIPDDGITFDTVPSTPITTITAAAPTPNDSTCKGRRSDFGVTFFTGAKSSQPSDEWHGTWEDFVDLCEHASTFKFHRSNKLAAPAMISGRCEGKRANENVRFLSMVAADFDIAPDDARYRAFDDMVAHLASSNLAFVIYTTTTNTAGHNRYRVIMPLARNVSPDIWPAVWQAANAKFEGAFDAATKDPARLSFLPAVWIGDTFHDARKGVVTLVDAFNDFASSSSGRPILDDAEIDACVDKAARMAARAITPPQRPAVQKPVMHSIGNGDIDGPAVSPDVWSILTALNGPLVSPWMMDELPRKEGSRTYRFLKSAALRARQQGLQINVDLLCNLAMKWLRRTRSAPPPADLMRQAQNALNFAFQQQ